MKNSILNKHGTTTSHTCAYAYIKVSVWSGVNGHCFLIYGAL